MPRRTLLILALAVLLAAPAFAQKTPETLVASYDSLADVILAVRQMEENVVRAVLDAHRRAAETAMQRGDAPAAAAEIALFANEGDNAVGGIRKRLVEGGHHHHAADEAAGIYDPAFVIVTRQAKGEALEISAALQKAATEPARQEAWSRFVQLADRLLASK
jgi:hypothetical protein